MSRPAKNPVVLTVSFIDEVAELYYKNYFYSGRGYKVWGELENQNFYRTTVLRVLSVLNERENNNKEEKQNE